MSVSGQVYRGVVRATSGACTYINASVSTSNTWYEFIAATSGAIYVTGVAWSGTNINTIDVGVGAAASEVAVASASGVGLTATNYVVVLTVPVRVPTGTRVSVRVNSGGSYSGTCTVMYCLESQVI